MGYLIQIICLILLLILILTSIGNLFLNKHNQEDSSFLIGYYIGTFLGLFMISWPIYKFYRFGGKLIRIEKNKSKISEIGIK